MKKRTGILTKIAAPVMGLVVAGATMLTPMSAMAKEGDSSSWKGEINRITCSGYTAIDSSSATATTVFYGTGTLTSSVNLLCKESSGTYRNVYASKSDSAVVGISATAVRKETSWKTEYADGIHTIVAQGHRVTGTTRASR